MLAPRSSYRLPQELTGLVMKNLSRNRTALCTASLVCKAWAVESSRVLFEIHTIELKRPHDAEWLATLKGSTRIRTNVRHLRVKAMDEFCQRLKLVAPRYVFEHLAQALLYLPNLRSLELYWAHLKCGPEGTEALAGLRARGFSLRRLAIEYIPGLSCSAPTQRCYVRLLQAVASLDELYIGSNDEWSKIDGADYLKLQDIQPTPPLRVKRVTVTCRSALPLLDWVCGEFGPSPLDTGRVESLEMPVHPESIAPNSTTRPCLKLLTTLTGLRELKLDVCLRALAAKREHVAGNSQSSSREST
ncbi:hypothetical protein PHLGIDRAFT_485775 [Phlebiopsis gigantea 11061_1 CR5-6]|uniref:F-box domain-containing protein n=1 Tax=Phlebiopsis gigantea (strain 11061_1 CR5-6) TaxID=745531 RepID=A0A0C3S8Z7_PHLG1|nr:hypothetical protein PHLGIDRAFT_485775 [Phlebiopsis gigantea 11061_1 CR5-6]